MKIISIILGFILVTLGQCFKYNETLAKNLAGFSLVSYCNPSLIKKWNCGFACEQNSEGLVDIQILFNSTMNASGYIGYSQIHNAIVVVFRGTLPWSIKNWLRNINFISVKYSYCNDECTVHKGFLKHFNDLKQQLIDSFLKIREKYPTARIFVTGHSLGAAMSAHSLPILYELNRNLPIDVFYNFGSPRVGDKSYSNWFINQNFVLEYARINNNGDPVPHLPPYQFPFNFFHYGKEIFYKSFKKYKNEYTTCNESESSECMRSIKFAYNIPDHLTYFGWSWGKSVLQCQIDV